eukprot:4112323-Amphidinium_carterae.2
MAAASWINKSNEVKAPNSIVCGCSTPSFCQEALRLGTFVSKSALSNRWHTADQPSALTPWSMLLRGPRGSPFPCLSCNALGSVHPPAPPNFGMARFVPLV